MPARAKRKSFSDYFNPADFAHVNWLSGHQRTVLTGADKGRMLNSERVDAADEVDESRDIQTAVDTLDLAKSADEEFASRLAGGLSLRSTLALEDREDFAGGHDALEAILPALDLGGGGRIDNRRTADVREPDESRLPESRGDPLQRALVKQRAVNGGRWETRPPWRESDRALRTLEYDPDRDKPEFLPVVRRDRAGTIQFVPIRRLDDRGHFEGGRWVKDPYDLGFIVTDNGTRVTAKKHLGTEPRYRSNCHGYVFADGEYWIDPWEVDKILTGDGYTQLNLREDSLRPGDVVIYRDERGNPFHSAVVVGRNPQTGEVIVEGIRGTKDLEPHRSSIYRQTDGMKDKVHAFELWRSPRDNNRRRRRK